MSSAGHAGASVQDALAAGKSSAPRPFIGVVADDITGAGDIGVMFAKYGYATCVFTLGADLDRLPERGAAARADVVIIDIDSRFDPPDAAYAKVRRAAAALKRAGCNLFWKKTCSAFRGNVGAEFDALLDELGASFGVAVIAFPKNGRQTRGGIHYVHGRLLSESEFARDPVHPMTDSNLVAMLERQARRRVGLVPLETVRMGAEAVRKALEEARAEGIGYALCDAESQEDLKVLASAAAAERIVLGSSALAEELPLVWEKPAPFDPLEGVDVPRPGGVLVVAGSVMPQSRAQVAALEREGALVLTLEGELALTRPERAVSDLVLRAVEALGGGRHVVVRSQNSLEAVEATRRLGQLLGLDAVAVSRRISSLLARTARAVIDETGIRRLVVLGGDTSEAVCRELGVTETLILDEIAPGLPSSLAPGPEPLLLVLKAGSFGGPRFVLEAVEHLNRLGRH